MSIFDYIFPKGGPTGRIISIILRKDTVENWFKINPILRDGEPGYVIDLHRVKIGDGETCWNNLPYSGITTIKDDGTIPGTQYGTYTRITGFKNE